MSTELVSFGSSQTASSSFQSPPLPAPEESNSSWYVGFSSSRNLSSSFFCPAKSSSGGLVSVEVTNSSGFVVGGESKWPYLTPWKLNRWMVLGLYCLALLFSGNVYWGWACGLREMLFKAGAYGWLPEEEQNIRIANLLINGFVSQFTVSVFAGICLDFMGPKITVIAGQLLKLCGWLVLMFSSSSFNGFTVAFIFIAASVDLSNFPLFSICNIFPEYQSIVMSLMGACSAVSVAVPLIMYTIWQIDAYWSDNSFFRVLCGFYIGVCLGYCLLVAFFFVPCNRFLTPPVTFEGRIPPLLDPFDAKPEPRLDVDKKIVDDSGEHDVALADDGSSKVFSHRLHYSKRPDPVTAFERDDNSSFCSHSSEVSQLNHQTAAISTDSDGNASDCPSVGDPVIYVNSSPKFSPRPSSHCSFKSPRLSPPCTQYSPFCSPKSSPCNSRRGSFLAPPKPSTRRGSTSSSRGNQVCKPSLSPQTSRRVSLSAKDAAGGSLEKPPKKGLRKGQHTVIIASDAPQQQGQQTVENTNDTTTSPRLSPCLASFRSVGFKSTINKSSRSNSYRLSSIDAPSRNRLRPPSPSSRCDFPCTSQNSFTLFPQPCQSPSMPLPKLS